MCNCQGRSCPARRSRGARGAKSWLEAPDGEMRALGRVLLWLQLWGKWGAQAEGPLDPEGQGSPRGGRPGSTGVCEGRGVGTGPSAGAALLRSGAVQVPAAARGRRPAPQRASVSRPEGAADPPPSHQASACLRRRPPRLRSPKRCSRALPRPPVPRGPCGRSPRSEPSWPLPADPGPFHLAGTSASAFTSVLGCHCPCLPVSSAPAPGKSGAGQRGDLGGRRGGGAFALRCRSSSEGVGGATVGGGTPSARSCVT